MDHIKNSNILKKLNFEELKIILIEDMTRNYDFFPWPTALL